MSHDLPWVMSNMEYKNLFLYLNYFSVINTVCGDVKMIGSYDHDRHHFGISYRTFHQSIAFLAIKPVIIYKFFCDKKVINE